MFEKDIVTRISETRATNAEILRTKIITNVSEEVEMIETLMDNLEPGIHFMDTIIRDCKLDSALFVLQNAINLLNDYKESVKDVQ